MRGSTTLQMALSVNVSVSWKPGEWANTGAREHIDDYRMCALGLLPICVLERDGYCKGTNKYHVFNSVDEEMRNYNTESLI